MTATAFAKKFGEDIRIEREKLGFSQAEIAEAAGFSQSALSSWELGTTQISAYNRAKLKSFFKRRKVAISAKAGGRLRNG